MGVRAAHRTARFGLPINASGMQALLLVALSAGLVWLVWLYGTALRDARYLDGWLLGAGMMFQLSFHIGVKSGWLTPKTSARWRRVHVFVGYLLIALFVSHLDATLPDTAFEWALAGAFVLISVSGVVGVYLAWSQRTRHDLDPRLGSERIAARRAELAREVEGLVTAPSQALLPLDLPAPPTEAWISALYADKLHAFFNEHHHVGAHLIGSQRHRKRLTDEIDMLMVYVDQHSQAKLAAIRDCVIEKDRLDFTAVRLGLGKVWLIMHIPATYAVVVLTILHVVVVYAYSSRIW